MAVQNLDVGAILRWQGERGRLASMQQTWAPVVSRPELRHSWGMMLCRPVPRRRARARHLRMVEVGCIRSELSWKRMLLFPR